VKTKIQISTVESDAVLNDRDTLLTTLNVAVGTTISAASLTRAPRKLGELAVADPSSISLILHTLDVGGVAGAFAAIAKVLIEWAKIRARPLKLTVGRTVVELPPGEANIPDIERIIAQITTTPAPGQKRKIGPKKRPSRKGAGS
jgi:hypothetical protein